MTLGTVQEKFAKIHKKLERVEEVSKSRCQLDTKKILDSSTWRHEKN